MGVITPSVQPQNLGDGRVEEEIEGLIRVYEGGRVQRFPVVREVPSSWETEPGVTSGDAVVDASTRVWARFYVPSHAGRRPLLVYFHGGGFCLGSASWESYHRFSAMVAAQACCVVMSVNYRVAPEDRLPAAYDDAVAAVRWAVRAADCGAEDSGWWWRHRCDFSRVFLGGDSAGGAVAYHAAARLSGLPLKGMILIQPFFGGEERTPSERRMGQVAGSPLSLKVSDTYWRLALPVGARRDHPWCNPAAAGAGAGGQEVCRLPPVLTFAAEMDILRDRILELCKEMRREGRSVDFVLHGGVSHAFQVLDSSLISQDRTRDMISRIKTFVDKHQ
ncbi:unnamed protein product [Spirodela intermedia]|uniref:Alpha/beta hydrolase fold-3 domain-containing protein n=1 Tax=Spirodela intermedia TaxID=51605 RepID=A0A7I8KGW4_SPIIN|nr:unnamed protein product [Spirodela intermedia]